MTKHVLCYLFIVSLIKVGTIMAGHRHIHTTENRQRTETITSLTEVSITKCSTIRHATCHKYSNINLNILSGFSESTYKNSAKP